MIDRCLFIQVRANTVKPMAYVYKGGTFRWWRGDRSAVNNKHEDVVYYFYRVLEKQFLAKRTDTAAARAETIEVIDLYNLRNLLPL